MMNHILATIDFNSLGTAYRNLVAFGAKGITVFN